YLQDVIERTVAARALLTTIADDNGLRALPSAANFVTMDCGRDGAFATVVLQGLLARGIFVRMPGVAPLNRCIRVSCGPQAELDAFAAALPGALSDAQSQCEGQPA
ncbi:MAG: pyridoxal phosphate-dependent aminotransferase, partial [Pseudomonadota bacterium]